MMTLILFIEYHIYYYILLLFDNIFHLYRNPHSLALRSRSIPDFILYYSYCNIVYKLLVYPYINF